MSHHFTSMRIAIGISVLAVLIFFIVQPAGATWHIYPDLRITGGDESDFVVDPGVTRVVVPGGPFAEIAPTLAARRWIGQKTLMDLGTFATLQQFINSESRLLYAHSAWGHVFHNFSNSIRGRLTATLDFYDDSERETVRRWGAGAEAGVAVIQSTWSGELWGSARGRRYPKLMIDTGNVPLVEYTEGTWSGGGVLQFKPAARINLQADGIFESTDSRDPLFDSVSWTARSLIDTRLVRSVYLTVSGTYQERKFDNRVQGENMDSFWQIGAGLRYAIKSNWIASIRLGHSQYTWPEGNREDSHRVAAGISYSWGGRNVLPMPTIDIDALVRESSGSIQKPAPDGSVSFRIHAPGASSVLIGGTFNDWNFESAPLHSAGGGWWETRIALEPGAYEYAYIIDGVWTTPPEAKSTVNDGFGGFNGILEVLPADL